MEGYAFANFGYSSETEVELRHKMENSFWDSFKIRQKKLKTCRGRESNPGPCNVCGFQQQANQAILILCSTLAKKKDGKRPYRGVL